MREGERSVSCDVTQTTAVLNQKLNCIVLTHTPFGLISRNTRAKINKSKSCQTDRLNAKRSSQVKTRTHITHSSNSQVFNRTQNAPLQEVTALTTNTLYVRAEGLQIQCQTFLPYVTFFAVK